MLGKTSDGEFIKLLRIRELDNDDVADQPDSTDENSPPNLSINWPTSCGAVWSGHWLHRMKYSVFIVVCK